MRSVNTSWILQLEKLEEFFFTNLSVGEPTDTVMKLPGKYSGRLVWANNAAPDQTEFAILSASFWQKCSGKTKLFKF